MKLIKLDTIDSTNSFLKEMSGNMSVENFTVVMAQQQTAGRGQMNTQWDSEVGKNLTFSVFFGFGDLSITNQKFLNFSIALGIYQFLKRIGISNLAIKWPNDILAEGKKICGVLIENSLKGTKIVSSVIGIGVNVHQDFKNNENVNAVSIKDILNKEFDLENLLNQLIDQIKFYINQLEEKKYSVLEKSYLEVLYKKGLPSMFKTSNDTLFMGKIIGVSSQGKLQIETDDERIHEFGIKEVSFA